MDRRISQSMWYSYLISEDAIACFTLCSPINIVSHEATDLRRRLQGPPKDNSEVKMQLLAM